MTIYRNGFCRSQRQDKGIKNYVLNNLPFLEFIITSASDDAGKTGRLMERKLQKSIGTF